jgi:predicted secreted acid phosphatase
MTWHRIEQRVCVGGVRREYHPVEKGIKEKKRELMSGVHALVMHIGNNLQKYLPQ